MSEKWLTDTLCSLGDDTVRIELGPQLVQLDCTDKNLSDNVTAVHYRVGARDSLGKVLMPERVKSPDLRMGGVKEGEVMNILDWPGKHKPHAWKVYKLKQDGSKKKRFMPVAEYEEKARALMHARSLVGKET